jgi:hypothetical protein
MKNKYFKLFLSLLVLLLFTNKVNASLVCGDTTIEETSITDAGFDAVMPICEFKKDEGKFGKVGGTYSTYAEAYAAGELKHGTISLIEDGTLVVGILTQKALIEKTISNMTECKARGAYLMALTCYGNYSAEDSANFTVYVPKTDPHFMASLAVVPLQLFGYYSGVARGLDVDKPRNLAKSVTVE